MDYHPDSVILGCTHFPLLGEAITSVLPPGTSIVDSASTTAVFAEAMLTESGLASAQPRKGDLRLLATDGATRFARVGGQFLGCDLAVSDVELVDL
jgi:glutamate racemase